MSEQKKRPTDTDSVDWAERLKASMDQAPAEAPPTEPTIPDGEDDLAALLRAQLQKQAASAPSLDLPDTDDFEEDYEEKFEEELEEEFEEEPEEEFEEEPEEEFEEEPEEELEEELEEEFEEEPEEEPEEEFEEEPVEEPEEEPEEEFEEELEEELEEEFEEEPEEEFEEELEEEPEEEPEEELEEELEEDASASAASMSHSEFTIPHAEFHAPSPTPITPTRLSDHHLNSTREDDAHVGNYTERLRLRRLEAMNDTLMVEDDDAYAYDPAPAEADRPAEDAADEERVADALTAPEAVRPAPVLCDPLQSGFAEESLSPFAAIDDELPVGGVVRHHTPPPEREAPAPAAPTHTYTDSMASDDPSAAEDRDTELYLRLGYESELRHAEEQARIERLRAERLRSEQRGSSQPDMDAPAEGTASRRPPARPLPIPLLIITLAGVAVGVIWDAIYILGVSFPSLHMAPTYLHPAVMLAILCLFSAPIIPRLFRGVRGLWDFEPTRYTPAALGLAVTAAYSAVSLVLALAEVRLPLPSLGSVALSVLALSALSEFFTDRAAHRSASILSAGKPLYVLTDKETPAARALCDSAPAEVGRRRGTPRVLSVVEAARVEPPVSRSDPHMARLNILTPIALIAAIIATGVSVAMGGDFLSDGLTVFAATYLLCLPVAYLVGIGLPFSLADRHIAPTGTAVTDASVALSVGRAEDTTLLLRDSEVLVAACRKEITLRDDPDAAAWRRIASRVFHVTGSPLAQSIPFDDDTPDRETLSRLHAEIAETDVDFLHLYLIEQVAENRRETVDVMMGSHEALSRRGIRLPKIGMEESYKKSPDSHVLYLAFDGHFRIAYAAEYRPGRAFLRMLPTLRGEAAGIALVTHDPLLSATMLAAPRFAPLGDVTLVRPAYIETSGKTRAGGLVATDAGHDLVYPLRAARVMKRAYRVARICSVAAPVLGLGFSVGAILIDRHALIHLTSPALLALSLGLTALAALGSLLIVRRTAILPPDPAGKPRDGE